MGMLSKSDLMSYNQCPKRLWLEKHRPDLKNAEPNEMLIAAGNAVGEIARGYFKEGIHIDTLDNEDALQITAGHISLGKPLYEPAFEHSNTRVRVDILHDNTLTEVKSGSSLKKHYVLDAAIQAWVVKQSNIPLDKVQLALVNSDFIYQGNDYDRLLKFQDITEQVEVLYDEIPSIVQGALNTIQGAEPNINTGAQCSKPYPCPFMDYCKAGRPQYPVESLPRIRNADVAKLHSEGIYAIEDIPEGYLSNAKHEKVRRTVISGQPEIDSKLVAAIHELPYPRYFLDFEAIAFVIPEWKGARTNQTHPFQWSCHIESDGGEMNHKEFLDITGSPPDRPFAESLLEHLGGSGPVFVYSSYEERVIKNLQNLFPDLAVDLGLLIDRLEDLLPLMREHYYHPEQHGSWSIKALLPIVTPELNYKSLNNVQNGLDAQMAYVQAINPATDEATKKQLEIDMLTYCKLDTLAMVKLVEYISKLEL